MIRICPLIGLGILCACTRVGERNAAVGAIKAVQMINTAESEYLSRYHDYGDLGQLVGVGVLSGQLAEGRIEISIECKGRRYAITARPVNREYPSYYSDETFVMHVASGTATPTADSPQLR
jgi:hypothetical protein